MNDEEAQFLAAMVRADKIASSYEKAVCAFNQLYSLQHTVLAGTVLGDYLKRLDECVGEAVGLNCDAGWLQEGAKFTQQEYLHALIRRDRASKRYRTAADLPIWLQEEDDDEEPDDGTWFAAFSEELRECCRSAYSNMEELREIMNDEPTGEGLLNALYAWPSETGESEDLVGQTHALHKNLHQGWHRCKKAGLALLCMANQFGDNDPDYDMAIAFME